MYDIGDAWELGIALLDDGEGEHGQVHANDAAADRLSLALAGSSRSVARVAVGEEEADTGWVHNTLLHCCHCQLSCPPSIMLNSAMRTREALLVVAARDLEDVALELVAQAVALDFLAHSAVQEDAQLAFIVDLDQLLRAIRRVGDVELHLDGCWVKM